jgi:hypothetical protein
MDDAILDKWCSARESSNRSMLRVGRARETRIAEAARSLQSPAPSVPTVIALKLAGYQLYGVKHTGYARNISGRWPWMFLTMAGRLGVSVPITSLFIFMAALTSVAAELLPRNRGNA